MIILKKAAIPTGICNSEIESIKWKWHDNDAFIFGWNPIEKTDHSTDVRVFLIGKFKTIITYDLHMHKKPDIALHLYFYSFRAHFLTFAQVSGCGKIYLKHWLWGGEMKE